jgi:DNA-binding MarR family transcriptional regulator
MSNRRASTSRDVHDIAMALQAVVWSLRRFGEHHLGPDPLPQSEFEVLRVIGEQPGVTMTDVARTLALQSSNVSVTVRKLVERGLVRRSADTLDRRAVRLSLTPLAASHKETVDAAWDDAVAAHLNTLPHDDAVLLAKAAPLLRGLADMA